MSEVMEYDDILAGLREASGWSLFARSLLQHHNERGELSYKQWDAAEGFIKRSREKSAQRQAAPVVDISRIEALLNTAREHGLKKPVFRASGLAFSFAPATGVNAGAVYVKQAGEYMGKLKDGKFHRVSQTPADVAQRLIDIAADPRGKAIDYGRETGTCACCGRTLTDPKSIELGIGPICIEQWGL